MSKKPLLPVLICRIVQACILVITIAIIDSCSNNRVQSQRSPVKVKDHGVLRVDDNKRYFVFEDGTSYIPIGLNNFLLRKRVQRLIRFLTYVGAWDKLSSHMGRPRC